MTSIFAITSDILELERIIEQEETIEGSHEDIADFIIPAKEEALARKIDAYVSVYRSLEAKRAARKNEAKHLTAMAKADENSMKRLKEAIKFVSQQLGEKKLKGETHTITISTPKRPAIDVVDVALVPTAYKEQVFTWKVNKKEIVEHLMETGEALEGVEYRKVTRVLMR